MDSNLTLRLGSWKAMVQPYSKVSYRPQPRTGAGENKCLVKNLFDSSLWQGFLFQQKLVKTRHQCIAMLDYLSLYSIRLERAS